MKKVKLAYGKNLSEAAPDAFVNVDPCYEPIAERYTRELQLAVYKRNFAQARKILDALEQESMELSYPVPLRPDDFIARLENHGVCLRTINALEEKGIHTIRGLYNAGSSFVATIPNMGTGSLLEIQKGLESAGLPVWLKKEHAISCSSVKH